MPFIGPETSANSLLSFDNSLRAEAVSMGKGRVEAFTDGEAGAAHVQSPHFRQAQEDIPRHLLATPKIVSVMVDQQDWSELGEMRVD